MLFAVLCITNINSNVLNTQLTLNIDLWIMSVKVCYVLRGKLDLPKNDSR
jgi:hypothetical protein